MNPSTNQTSLYQSLYILFEILERIFRILTTLLINISKRIQSGVVPIM